MKMFDGRDTRGTDNTALKQLVLILSELVTLALHFFLTDHAAGGANIRGLVRFCFYGLSGNADLLFSLRKHCQIS